MRVVENGRSLTWSLEGEVAITRVDALHDAAIELEQRMQDVDVDCADVEHLDTSALQVLASLRAGLARGGRTLHLNQAPPRLTRYLELAGLTAFLLPREPSPAP